MLQGFGKGLRKTREKLGSRIGYLFRSREDEEAFYEELEEILVSSDVGVEASLGLVEDFRRRCAKTNIFGSDTMLDTFRDFLIERIPEKPLELSESGLSIIMLSGVNGTGKTTTTAKLTRQFLDQGKKVMLAAADTFRAAASEQLEVWARQLDVPIIRQQPGADPGAVVFDSLQSARAREMDVLLIDTAGRFHNRENLLKQLEKIARIIDKQKQADDSVIHLLVLDATAGGNASVQARSFSKTPGVDGVILSKMDSSARGGVVLALAEDNIPVLFLGLGEKVDDLVPFRAKDYVESLFGSEQ